MTIQHPTMSKKRGILQIYCDIYLKYCNSMATAETVEVTVENVFPRSDSDSPRIFPPAPDSQDTPQMLPRYFEEEFARIIDRRKSAATDLQIETLVRWMKTADVRKKAAGRHAAKNKLFDDWLQLFLRVIAGMMGGTSILNLVTLKRSDPNFAYNVLVAIFSILLLLLQSVDVVFKPGVKYNAYRNTCLDYTRFSRSLR